MTNVGMFDEIDLSHKFRKLKRENQKDKKTIDVLTTDNDIKDYEIRTLKEKINKLKQEIKELKDALEKTE
jgi:predicted  nucleic acid-binding Zn-ribbon protein